MAKTLIVLGAVLMAAGVIFLFLGRIPGIGKLPGDILIKKDDFTFYFPITTCLILSLIISLVLYFGSQK